MKYILFVLFLLTTCVGIAENWPAWRGPGGMGVSSEPDLPLKWSRTENVTWKASLPEPGNSTPIVWGDQVLVTQNHGTRRLILSFDRKTGAKQWESGIDFPRQEVSHKTNPYCSASAVTDGERVITSFASGGLYCCDLQGKELWRKDLGEQAHIWGNGASPIIHGDLCILNFGPGERTFLIAVDKQSGETRWKVDEPGGAFGKGKDWIGSWSTPVIVDTGKRVEMLMSWPGRLCAYDPLSGKEYWTCGGLNPLIYTSPIYADGIAVAMGGYGGKGLAVRVGGKGDVTAQRLWHHPKIKQRIGSAVIHGDHFYILTDAGIAECVELKTGKLVWQERVQGQGGRPKNWSSLMLSGDRLYAINQSGDCPVFKASPTFELLAVNALGETSNSSVVPSQGNLFIRTHRNLWCIGP